MELKTLHSFSDGEMSAMLDVILRSRPYPDGTQRALCMSSIFRDDRYHTNVNLRGKNESCYEVT